MEAELVCAYEAHFSLLYHTMGTSSAGRTAPGHKKVDVYGKLYFEISHLINRLEEKLDISLCKGIKALSEQHVFPVRRVNKKGTRTNAPEIIHKVLLHQGQAAIL